MENTLEITAAAAEYLKSVYSELSNESHTHTHTRKFPFSTKQGDTKDTVGCGLK
jgi:hypothetical protein